MGKKLVNKYTVGIFLIAITSLTIIGCGKNVIGPTAPQAISSQALDAVQQSTAISGANADADSLQAACFKGKKGKRHRWSRQMVNACLSIFNPWSVKKFINNVLELYVVDPQVRKTVKRILRSRLFYIITFRCGLGSYLFEACLGILKQSWSPGLGTNPGGFDPEVTLFPYSWNPYSGFCDPRMLGWETWTNGTIYYRYDHFNISPDGDRTEVSTFSYDGDIYQNQNNINQFAWDFLYTHHQTGNQGSIRLKLYNDCLAHKLRIANSTKIKEMDGNWINFYEVWASTQNKSGCCIITASNLDMNLKFEPSGKGDGYLKIGDDLYEFTVYAGGRHGYWTKNSGRKHYF